jgi:hypothetical protein
MHDKRDYAVDRRLLRIAALALLIGVASTLVAHVLLALIRLFTNLFFIRRFRSRRPRLRAIISGYG